MLLATDLWAAGCMLGYTAHASHHAPIQEEALQALLVGDGGVELLLRVHAQASKTRLLA
jgi:hypothetical protein